MPCFSVSMTLTLSISSCLISSVHDGLHHITGWSWGGSTPTAPSELQSSHLDGMRPRFTSKQLPSSSTANNAANEQKQRDMWLHGHGVPRTYVDRQKKINRIVEMHSPVRLERMRLPLKRHDVAGGCTALTGWGPAAHRIIQPALPGFPRHSQ